MQNCGVGPDLKGLFMVAFGKCKGGGRRSAPRSSAPLIAIVTTLTASHSAVLLDVSATGARLQGPDLPQTGEDLFVSIERVVAFGTVVWAKESVRGIAFDEPLNPRDEQQLRQRVSQAHGLPPEIKAAFDDWVLGVAR